MTEEDVCEYFYEWSFKTVMAKAPCESPGVPCKDNEGKSGMSSTRNPSATSGCAINELTMNLQNGNNSDILVGREVAFRHNNTSTVTTLLSRRSSDVCAICLGAAQCESFLSSCLHSFCFECIKGWSKVKAVCPKCKRAFSSILHNVGPDGSYDQYFTSSQTQEEPQRPTDTQHLSSNRASTDAATKFRGRIYRSGLWVVPQDDGTNRSISPEYFQQNPGYSDRLKLWLNRELRVLLSDNEGQITRVVDLMLSLITRYHIRSEEFHAEIQPYMPTRARHFIHEFQSFAASPLLDLHSYDNNAVYEYATFLPRSFTDFSLPPSHVVPLATSTNTASENSDATNVLGSGSSVYGNVRESLQRREHSSSARSRLAWPFRLSSRCDLRSSLSVLCRQAPTGSASKIRELLNGNVLGRSKSRLRAAPSHVRNQGQSLFICENSESSGVDDDCVFVGVVNSRESREYEIIDLVSTTGDDEETNDSALQNCGSSTQVISTGSSSEWKKFPGSGTTTVQTSAKKQRLC